MLNQIHKNDYQPDFYNNCKRNSIDYSNYKKPSKQAQLMSSIIKQYENSNNRYYNFKKKPQVDENIIKHVEHNIVKSPPLTPLILNHKGLNIRKDIRFKINYELPENMIIEEVNNKDPKEIGITNYEILRDKNRKIKRYNYEQNLNSFKVLNRSMISARPRIGFTDQVEQIVAYYKEKDPDTTKVDIQFDDIDKEIGKNNRIRKLFEVEKLPKVNPEVLPCNSSQINNLNDYNIKESFTEDPTRIVKEIKKPCLIYNCVNDSYKFVKGSENVRSKWSKYLENYYHLQDNFEKVFNKKKYDLTDINRAQKVLDITSNEIINPSVPENCLNKKNCYWSLNQLNKKFSDLGIKQREYSDKNSLRIKYPKQSEKFDNLLKSTEKSHQIYYGENSKNSFDENEYIEYNFMNSNKNYSNIIDKINPDTETKITKLDKKDLNNSTVNNQVVDSMPKFKKIQISKSNINELCKSTGVNKNSKNELNINSKERLKELKEDRSKVIDKNYLYRLKYYFNS